MINKEKYYSIKGIFNMKVFPWILSYDTLRRWISMDISSGEKSLFKAIRKGTGNGTRYYIKGETLINLIKELKTGKRI